MGYKWKPGKAARKAFALEMEEINSFCAEHGISQSASSDSYYFSINGQNYRVSNHSIECSNAKAFDQLTGEQRRALYHAGGREADTTYIHASKTRIREIYSDLSAGHKLDSRGYRI